jgi:hypothetical protein
VESLSNHRLILLYPVFAILNLFCKIVMHPSDADNAVDLELLSYIPTFVRSVDMGHLTELERQHVDVVAALITELHAMAQRAVVASGRVLEN